MLRADPVGEVPPFGGQPLPPIGPGFPAGRSLFRQLLVGGRGVEGVPELLETGGEGGSDVPEPGQVAVGVEGVGEDHAPGLFEQTDREPGTAAAHRARGGGGAQADGAAQQELLVVADELAWGDGVQQIGRHHVAVQGTVPVAQLRTDLTPGPCRVQPLGGWALLLQGRLPEHVGGLGQIGPAAAPVHGQFVQDAAEGAQARRALGVAGRSGVDGPAVQRDHLASGCRRQEGARVGHSCGRGRHEGPRQVG